MDDNEASETPDNEEEEEDPELEQETEDESEDHVSEEIEERGGIGTWEGEAAESGEDVSLIDLRTRGTILSDLHLRTMSQLPDLMPTSIDAYSSPALSISLLQEVSLPRETSRITCLTLASVS